MYTHTTAIDLYLHQEDTNCAMYADDSDPYLIFKPSELTANVADNGETSWSGAQVDDRPKWMMTTQGWCWSHLGMSDVVKKIECCVQGMHLYNTTTIRYCLDNS